MKVNQTKFGEQEKAYGDHVYEWEIELGEYDTKSELLDYCQKELKNAPRSRLQYLEYIRGEDALIDEILSAMCAGYYELSESKSGGRTYYTYRVIEPYID